MSATEPNRRQQILDVLREADDPLTLTAVADRLGVHTNTVRFHVDQLLQTGQVEQVEVAPQGRGRPAAHFRSARRMDPTGPRQYQALAEILLDAVAGMPDRRERALAAGRAWGRTLAEQQQDTADTPTDRLVTLLGDVGFAPHLRHEAGADQVALRHCPFLELAQERSEVICPIHLGLMQGALREWGSDVDGVRLDPFVEPDLCLAHLDRVST